jgi:hypothetical protein
MTMRTLFFRRAALLIRVAITGWVSARHQVPWKEVYL